MMTRIFIGLEIPEIIRHRLVALQAEMPGCRWQSAEQMHLTLRFLGDVEEKRLPDLVGAMRETMMPPFEISARGAGCFNRNTKPIILWVGVHPLDAVTVLYKRLSERLQVLGFEQEDKDFIPHITIARLKRLANVESFIQNHQQFGTDLFGVSHISMFSSTAGPNGSHYEVLHRSALESGKSVLQIE